MKEKKYHVALDEYEHSILIRCLNDERNQLIGEGRSADAVDDLIVKVGTAKQKNCRSETHHGSDAR